MKFSGTTYQDNAVRFSSQYQADVVTLLFDNVGVKLTGENPDRTASHVSAFAIPVITEASEQAPEVTVLLSGIVALDPGVRATFCVSIGDRATLVDLPSGLLSEQLPDSTKGQAEIRKAEDNSAFERQLTAMLPAGAEEILITLFLLVERVQKSKTAFGQLQLDHLQLILQSAT